MIKQIANWGNYPSIESNVLSFSSHSQLQEIMRSQQKMIGRGNGRCYGDASLASTTVLTLKFDKVLSFDTARGIFESESGITLDKILEIIVPKGWFLPVSPGTKYITLGGAVASNVHGKNHHVDGPFSNHIVDMDVWAGKGEFITCSPGVYADLFDGTCGGMGLTGLITRVKFRLKKIETSYIVQKQIKAANLDDILQLFDKYHNATYSVAWIDCLKKGKDFGRSILILGEHAGLHELEEKRKHEPFFVPDKKHIVFPFNLPSFVLNKYTISAFNFLYYSKNLKREIDNTVHYEPFFYPLDAILHWNRGYGKKGFVQYQFVVPIDKKQGLGQILNRISEKGMGSFLAVLKKFGRHDSTISFPIEGYTLALDFPIRKGLFEFLNELDEIVLQFGGRIYLTKDARMKADVFWKSYPGADRFSQIVKKYNPDYKFSSLQSNRLLITK
ncbi:MAG: FAD-binding oxidoreductase [Chitinophagaceae bacterium]